MVQKIQLINRNGNVFDEVTIPNNVRTPEAILLANQVFLPIGKDKYRQAICYEPPLPPLRGLTGH